MGAVQLLRHAGDPRPLHDVDRSQNGGLGFATAEAAAIFGLYAASVYLTGPARRLDRRPLLGLRARDLVGGLVIALGHICSRSPALAAIFFSASSIAIGTGLLKPNISAMVGELYDKDDIGGRDAGFSIFYMGINVGAILGALSPATSARSGAGTGASAPPRVAMFLGLLNFIYASRNSLAGKGLPPLPHHHPDAATGRRDHVFTGVIVAAVAGSSPSPR